MPREFSRGANGAEVDVASSGDGADADGASGGVDAAVDGTPGAVHAPPFAADGGCMSMIGGLSSAACGASGAISA